VTHDVDPPEDCDTANSDAGSGGRLCLVLIEDPSKALRFLGLSFEGLDGIEEMNPN